MIGAQASRQQFDKILSYIDIAKEEGAEMLTGGERPASEGELASGYYIQPTLIKGDNKMRVFQEEIFGPVIGVTTFKDEAEALAIANETQFGLGAGIWTRDINLAYRMGRASRPGASGLTAITSTRRTRRLVATRSPASAVKPTRWLDHYQQTKNLLVSYDINPLGFF